MTIDFSKGHQLTRENFKILRLTAKQSYLSKNYGLASSLNVLSVEELVKSLFFFIRNHNPDVGLKNFEQVFKNHKIKHNELKEIIKSSYEGFDILYFNILEDKKVLLDRLPDERKDEFAKEYVDIERVKNRVDKIKGYQIQVDEILIWLQNSNDIKNNGLYIGLDTISGVWSTPTDYSKVTIKTELKYAKILYLCIENFEDIHIFMKNLKERQKNYS